MIFILLTASVLLTGAEPGVQPGGEIDLRCGSYCLFLCLNALGQGGVRFAELERQLGQPTANGYSMGQLAEVAQKRGFYSLGVVTNTDHLLARSKPFACIARIDGTHFVVLADVEDGNATIFDPPRSYELPLDTLRARWDGTALVISPQPLLAEEDVVSRSSPWTHVCIAAMLVVSATAAAVYYRRRAASINALAALIAFAAAAAVGCGRVPEYRAERVGPVIFFPEVEWNLGEIPVDPANPQAVEFPFENRGDSLLNVRRVTTTCGCIHPTLTQSELAPEERAVLRVEINRPAAETRTATVTVETNDSLRPVVHLSLSWRATTPVTFEPGSLEFGDVLAGQTATQTVAVARHSLSSGAFPEVGEPRSNSDALIATWAEHDVAREGASAGLEMLVRVMAGQKIGDYRGFVELRFDDSDAGITTLPVHWRVRNIVEAFPAALFLGSGQPGQRRRQTVVISTPAGQRILIKEVDLKPPTSAIDVTQKATTENSLILQLDAQLPPDDGEHRWELQISLIEPLGLTVTVPIAAHVRKIE